MAGTLKLLSRVMTRDGLVCFVIGRSKIHGQIVNNAEIIQNVAGAFGFERECAAERVVSPNRKSFFNLSHANIKTETVLMLRYVG